MLFILNSKLMNAINKCHGTNYLCVCPLGNLISLQALTMIVESTALIKIRNHTHIVPQSFRCTLKWSV